VEIFLPTEDWDFLTEQLWEMESLGMEELPAGDFRHCMAYFDATLPAESLQQEIQLRLVDHPAVRFKVQTIAFDEQVWVERFASQFRAFAINPTFYIYPPWDHPSPDHRVNILLEPGHGFGTGTHESTQLALSAIEEAVPSAESFLDVGTGSGILSVGAAKLKPSLKVTALDIDSLAVEEARENFQRNGIVPVGLFAGETACLRSSFDLVVANLTAPLLTRLAGELSRITGKNLVASGFTMDEAELVRQKLWSAGGLTVSNAWNSNDWSCFLFHRCTAF